MENNWKKSEVVLTNAKIVTRSDCFLGSIKVENGVISDVSSRTSAVKDAIDLGGDYLLPGLIDVHTDHLEKHIMPRPGTTWDALSAAVAYDTQICSAGVTTVFDSLQIGPVGNDERKRLLPLMLDGLQKAREHDLLRADHFLHLRCDTRDPDVLETFRRYAHTPELRFVTIMDDGPIRDRERYRGIEQRKKTPDAEIDALIAAAPISDRWNGENRRYIVEFCRTRALPFANHDDTKAEHVAEAVAGGATISEFPLSMEAATAARSAGMTVIVGGPNLVAGRSHVGYVSVRDLLANGLVDILCSDYVPGSILRAVWHLATDPAGLSMAEAVAFGSRRPAETFGFNDRGEIATGRRADLIHVTDKGGPIVRQAWVRGERVL
ncbi:alpha-D-ribose 1-methylphosphonate 5-triphosphate diphosphatase [Burkholderia cepacia]|uniref:alpha-D-ribose 1-methylphosphonate 5-triphosphate diphosphatase n=1 Tax=Burkholderia cepacia TaxID=292 RepID=UPI002AB7F096|nr:alpha-D-ribose 1-methylphosphonate 5-triphosphate diphosphatase [Burkholderia cepacia]